MKKVIQVNPSFERLKDGIVAFVEAEEVRFAASAGNYVGKGELCVDGLQLDVHWVDSPSWLKGMALQAFADTPAKRMYNEALWLSAHEIDVPVPIGYVEILSGLGVRCSAYLSLHRELQDCLTVLGERTVTARQVQEAFAGTLYALHRLGVFGSDAILRNLKIEADTHQAVWEVDGRLTVQHKSVPSRKAIHDLEELPLDAYANGLLARFYIEHAAARAFDSFEHWVFYQDMLRWMEKERKRAVPMGTVQLAEGVSCQYVADNEL